MQMEIIFECLCPSSIPHSFWRWTVQTRRFLCVTWPPHICAPASNCAAFEWALDGALRLLNEHDWGEPTVDVLPVAKVSIGISVCVFCSTVYQSGSHNLIFNSENDGCYIIIVAQRSCWLLCCGSCALPSVLLIKFLPKDFSVLLDWFQYEAKNKDDWQINCVLSQYRSKLSRISNQDGWVWRGFLVFSLYSINTSLFQE